MCSEVQKARPRVWAAPYLACWTVGRRRRNRKMRVHLNSFGTERWRLAADLRTLLLLTIIQLARRHALLDAARSESPTRCAGPTYMAPCFTSSLISCS